MKRIIIAGGAGFIGANFIFHMLEAHPEYRIICLDKLTYAGNLSTLQPVLEQPESLITFVPDRKGHDRRYAMDATKIYDELGWQPETDFTDGLKKTIRWYVENRQ